MSRNGWASDQLGNVLVLNRRVHHRQGAGELGVLEVEVVMPELVGRQHPLVDRAVGRQDADVEVFPRVLWERLVELDRVLRPLADEVQPPLEVGLHEEVLAHAQEHLADLGLGLLGRAADVLAVDRDVAPAEHDHLVLAGDALEDRLALGAVGGVAGQEHHAHRVLARLGQGDADLCALLAQERIRHADEQARAVAAVGLAPAPAAVVHALEHLEGVGHDTVRRLALDVADEPDAAGVVLVVRMVQPLGAWETFHHAALISGPKDVRAQTLGQPARAVESPIVANPVAQSQLSPFVHRARAPLRNVPKH